MENRETVMDAKFNLRQINEMHFSFLEPLWAHLAGTFPRIAKKGPPFKT
jgi:hypothetical protein